MQSATRTGAKASAPIRRGRRPIWWLGLFWLAAVGLAGCGTLRTVQVPGQSPGENAARLTVPAGFRVLQVNDVQRPGLGLNLFPAEETLVLEPGDYRIEVRYQDIYAVDRVTDDFKSFRSEPVWVEFTAKPGAAYALHADNLPTTDAEFAADPPVNIQVRQTQGALPANPSPVSPQGAEPSEALTTSPQRPPNEPPSLAPAAGATQAIDPAPVEEPAAAQFNPAQPSGPGGGSLLEAWERATAEEREQLLRHLIERP